MSNTTYTNFADKQSSITRITTTEAGNIVINAKDAYNAHKIDAALTGAAIGHQLKEQGLIIVQLGSLQQLGRALNEAGVISDDYRDRLKHGLSDQKMKDILDKTAKLLVKVGVNNASVSELGNLSLPKELRSGSIKNSHSAVPH